MPRRVVLRHAKTGDFDTAFAFHLEGAGEFIWPRTMEQFEELVQHDGIFIACEADVVRGLCYVGRPEEEWEFGGLFVDERLRGLGIAAALGRVAISSLYLYGADPTAPLIAHVHEENDLPRHVLNRLGFEATGEKVTIIGEGPPPTMRRNERDELVGDIFRFRRSALAEFADWFSFYDEALQDTSRAVDLDLEEVDLWRDRDETLPLLRELGMR